MVWHRYTQVCDEIRAEVNGKFLVVGLYVNNVIVVPQIPTQVPVLTFFVVLESDQAGAHNFTAQIEHVDTNTKVVEMRGLLQFQHASFGATPIRVSPMLVPLPGKYRLTMNVLPGAPSGPITTEFTVQLPLPRPAPEITQGPPQRGRSGGLGFAGGR